MADFRNRWADNDPEVVRIEGRVVSFYVDRECILCSVCSDLAPDNFRISDWEDHDVCYRQPRTAAELRACEDAMAACPVEAIGADGGAAGAGAGGDAGSGPEDGGPGDLTHKGTPSMR